MALLPPGTVCLAPKHLHLSTDHFVEKKTGGTTSVLTGKVNNVVVVSTDCIPRKFWEARAKLDRAQRADRIYQGALERVEIAKSAATHLENRLPTFNMLDLCEEKKISQQSLANVKRDQRPGHKKAKQRSVDACQRYGTAQELQRSLITANRSLEAILNYVRETQRNISCNSS